MGLGPIRFRDLNADNVAGDRLQIADGNPQSIKDYIDAQIAIAVGTGFKRDIFVGDGINNSFALTYVPTPALALSAIVFTGGVPMQQGAGEDFLVLGPNIVFNFIPPVGANISAFYFGT